MTPLFSQREMHMATACEYERLGPAFGAGGDALVFAGEVVEVQFALEEKTGADWVPQDITGRAFAFRIVGRSGAAPVNLSGVNDTDLGIVTFTISSTASAGLLVDGANRATYIWELSEVTASGRQVIWTGDMVVVLLADPDATLPEPDTGAASEAITRYTIRPGQPVVQVRYLGQKGASAKQVLIDAGLLPVDASDDDFLALLQQPANEAGDTVIAQIIAAGLLVTGSGGTIDQKAATIIADGGLLETEATARVADKVAESAAGPAGDLYLAVEAGVQAIATREGQSVDPGGAIDVREDAALAAIAVREGQATDVGGAIDVREDTAVALVTSTGDTQDARLIAEAATQITVVAAAALARTTYPSTAKAHSNGVASVAVTAAGSGGTNGVHTWTTTGGSGSGAYGTLTIAAGAVVAGSVVVQYRGDSYVTAPTIVPNAATVGSLTGVTLTASLSQNQPPGSVYGVADAAGVTYYQNVAGTATVIGSVPDVGTQDTAAVAVDGEAFSVETTGGRTVLAVDGAGEPVNSAWFAHKMARMAGIDHTALVYASQPRHNYATVGNWTRPQWWGGSVAGQSNGQAGNATPALSTTNSPYGNLLHPTTTVATLVPLKETTQESCMTAAADGASWRLRQIVPPWETVTQTFVMQNMAGAGLALSFIVKGTAQYAAGIARVTDTHNQAVAAGKTYAEKFLVLIHGENDNTSTNGGAGIDPAVYAAGIIQLKNDWNTDVAAINGQTDRIHLLIVALAPGSSNDTTAPYGSWPTLEGMISADATDPEVHIVSNGYSKEGKADGLHYRNYAQRHIGDDVSKAVHCLFNLGITPPQLRAGTCVRVAARLVKIPLRGWWVPPVRFNVRDVLRAPQYGFRVTHAGASVTISDVLIDNDAADPAIYLTTAADVVAGDIVSAAMLEFPNTIGLGLSVGCRTNICDSDRTPGYVLDEDGLPVELMNWLTPFKQTLA